MIFKMDAHLKIFLFLLIGILVLPSCSESDDDEAIEVAKAIETIVDENCVPIIAHRGCWGGTDFPQNSLAAFREALALNIYGTEFDVRQTRDGLLVINHDATYQGLAVADFDYADLSNYKMSNGETIPLLEDFLKAYVETETNVALIVELKSCRVADVISLLEAYEVMPHVIFISFSKSYCGQLVQRGYGSKVLYLGGKMSPEDVKAAGYAGIDYSHSVFQSNPEWPSQARILGLEAAVWTVNNMETIESYMADSVLVTTDVAKRVLALYEE